MTTDSKDPYIDGERPPEAGKPSTIRPFGQTDAPGSELDQYAQELHDRYQILELLGEGPIVSTFRAYDRRLSRHVALRLLNPEWVSTPEGRQRFLQEYSIVARLQHSSLPPVYGGRMEARQPYYTTKLLSSATLRDRLSSAPESANAQTDLLNAFILASQAVAYAHSQGVAHLALEPSRIHVGPFGEVFVVGWEQSRDLADDVLFMAPHQDVNRGPGFLLENLAYAAPECFRTQDLRLDCRTDVYALGSILCEILTGKPAVNVRPDGQIDPQSYQDSVQRLQDMDDELANLCLHALSPDPDERPEDAALLARSVRHILTSAQERAHVAEAAAAAAVHQAATETRTRRFVQAGLMSVVVLGIAGLALFLISHNRRTTELTEARTVIDKAIDSAMISRDLARNQQAGMSNHWADAIEHMQRAEDIIKTEDVGSELSIRVQRLSQKLHAEVEEARRRASTEGHDKSVRGRLFQVFSRSPDPLPAHLEQQELEGIFRSLGVELRHTEPEAIKKGLDLLPFPVDLADGLGWWERHATTLRVREKVAIAASMLDPDPWRTQVRDALRERNHDALITLLRGSSIENMSPGLMVAVVDHLAEFYPEEALDLLTRLEARLPNHYWPHVLRAELSAQTSPPDWDQVILQSTAALAVNPASVSARQLRAKARLAKGELTKAMVDLDDAIALRRDRPRLHVLRGRILLLRRAFTDAEISFQYALSLNEELGEAFDGLAKTQIAQGNSSACIETLRERVRTLPRDAAGWTALGVVLHQGKQVEEATEALGKASQLKPEEPGIAIAYAKALRDSLDTREAIRVLKTSLDHNPDHQQTWLTLAHFQQEMEHYTDAVRCATRVRELGGSNPEVELLLSKALDRCGRYGDALKALLRVRDSKDPAVKRGIDELRQKIAIDQRVDAIMSSKAPLPESNDKIRDLITHCAMGFDRLRTARFLMHVLDARPELRKGSTLTQAARAAVVAWLNPESEKLGADFKEVRAHWARIALDLVKEDAQRRGTATSKNFYRADPTFRLIDTPTALVGLPKSLDAEWRQLRTALFQ